MSDTDLDEKRLEAGPKYSAEEQEAILALSYHILGSVELFTPERARLVLAIMARQEAAIRAYKAAEGVGPVAWLDMRKEPAADWRERVVAVNPEYVANNGPEHFAPLYTHPAPASEGVTPEGWVLVPVELTGEMWVAGLKVFETEAEAFREAQTTAMAMARADRAPEKIYRAMLAARPAPPVEG